MKLSNYPNPLHFFSQLQNRNSYFYGYKTWKKITAVIYICIKCFLHFELLASNAIKNQTGKKFKNLLGINLVKHSCKFLAHIKKHLGHTGTTKNVQNDSIKLSAFGV